MKLKIKGINKRNIKALKELNESLPKDKKFKIRKKDLEKLCSSKKACKKSKKK